MQCGVARLPFPYTDAVNRRATAASGVNLAEIQLVFSALIHSAELISLKGRLANFVDAFHQDSSTVLGARDPSEGELSIIARLADRQDTDFTS